jgi:putative tricarboxylic transport membrane protein
MALKKKKSKSMPVYSGMDLFHKKDLNIALLLIAIGCFLFYEATKFPPPGMILGDTINADVFPKILVVILIFLAAVIPFEFRFAAPKIKKIDQEREEKIEPITWITLAFLIIIVLCSTFLGTILTMITTCLVFPIIWGEKRYVAVAIYSMLFPLGVYLLFNKLLSLYFEPGLLKLFQ